MKKLIGVFFYLFISCVVFSQTTFTEHIAPIIYNKCATCHRKGGIGPMTFTSYMDVKYASDMIQFAIDLKAMPPWMPNKNYSHFLDERYISDVEIQQIKDWVKSGMPEGPKAAEPDLPNFSDEAQLGKPDLSLSMKESFIHKGNNKDAYHVFVLPTNLKQGHNVKAIEIVPGNPKIAHHIILGLDTTKYANKFDEKDPSYGYEQYAGFGFYPTYDNWSGWIPGNKTRFFPADIGNYILPNSDVLLQMHYGPSPIDTKDSTTVNIYYADKPVGRYIRSHLISPNDIIDGPFYIPANKTKTFHAKIKAVEDMSIISITPHAHWIGKNWEVFSVTPKGDTTKLIKIDDWDFNWQNFFAFKNLIKIEKGSVIYCIASFDNTTNNKNNPNHPPKNVTWGESAFDEMFLCYMAYVPYKAGDEKIEIAGNTNSLFVKQENENITMEFSIIDNASVSIKLVDNNGKEVKQIVNNKRYNFGKHIETINKKELLPGTYYCKIKTSYFTDSKKIIIQ